MSKEKNTPAPDSLESLQLENAKLKELLKEAQARVEAAEKAASTVIASAPKGAKYAKAKMQLLGTGRRVINPGDAVNDDELPGLTEGVHFEFGTA
jgi:hypothetical protein